MKTMKKFAALMMLLCALLVGFLAQRLVRLCTHPGDLLVRGLEPVSYTHLDVYKRQPVQG